MYLSIFESMSSCRGSPRVHRNPLLKNVRSLNKKEERLFSYKSRTRAGLFRYIFWYRLEPLWKDHPSVLFSILETCFVRFSRGKNTTLIHPISHEQIVQDDFHDEIQTFSFRIIFRIKRIECCTRKMIYLQLSFDNLWWIINSESSGNHNRIFLRLIHFNTFFYLDETIIYFHFVCFNFFYEFNITRYYVTKLIEIPWGERPQTAEVEGISVT